MSRRKVTLLIIGLLVVLAFGFSTVPTNGVAMGSGVVPEGYIPIYNAEDLNSIRDNPYGQYILMNDIDLSGYDWEPIMGVLPSGERVPFAGVLDGNGHKIKNLKINKPGVRNVGLFAEIERHNQPASVKDLILENVNVTGSSHVGGLVGLNRGVIENVRVSGTIKGERYVGGIAGVNVGFISNCNTSGKISGNDFVSSITGSGSPKAIVNCSSTAVINGKTGSLTGGVETYTTFDGADEAYGFWYNVKNDKAEIYMYTGNKENVVIPLHIDGYPVVEVQGFTGNQSIKSVVIPNTVERLVNAFDNCGNLEKVVVPETVKLVKCSFGSVSGIGVKEVVFLGMDTEIEQSIGDDVLIKCKAGSKAHEYALKFNRKYELIP
ncbi:MAG: hypothetical protein PWQ60_444 [Thermoanaerobacteraceae bacterium]|nr:hypothetical protein [Thermoanaerobacteraceae bacterium]